MVVETAPHVAEQVPEKNVGITYRRESTPAWGALDGSDRIMNEYSWRAWRDDLGGFSRERTVEQFITERCRTDVLECLLGLELGWSGDTHDRSSKPVEPVMHSLSPSVGRTAVAASAY